MKTFLRSILSSLGLVKRRQSLARAVAYTPQPIAGYRQLTSEELALINEIKAKGAELDALVVKVRQHLINQQAAARDLGGAAGQAENGRILAAEPPRWAAMGRTELQTGLMYLTRAVAQPTGF